ncbi:M43 family zinc metalloprotease [Hymenobacter sp. CRA2]|uniref:M43 family zinc metalloprotease n=1 Tax=Hymenobacter sp. CRA2 TaxID=1955620 RepID=UPI0009901D10|nr:M43 family zinc metalloprotease [Hymenobacter sp. CRA2]OON69503.1 hypothetical protein B0919_09525 [Hymenobacter sp. CRA2]
MFRKTLPILGLAAAVLLGSVGKATAQRRLRPEHTYGFRCAYDSVQQAEFARNPGLQQDYQDFLRRVRQMSPADQARIQAQPDVTVPVVVHIIHTGGVNNISDLQVADALRIINRDFNKENADTATIDPRFRPIAARPGFRFRLAQKDPNGNCTTGITRTYSAQTAVGDNNVKNVIRWDVNRYLNIWVVDNANGAGGYALLPCNGGSLYDGIVIRNTQFAGIGRSCGTNFCARSLTHELGHYFGLPHTWGGTNTPGEPGNCGLDDGIADTPNTVGALQNCNLNEATCGPVANTENYMDYANCAKMFTLGQVAVMRASLTQSCRSTLVSATNLLATGTTDNYPLVPCAPVAAFQPSTTTVCQGSSVTFTEYSYNGNLTGATYQWSFPGGTPATSTARTVQVTYNTPGLYDVALTVSNAAGPGTTTRQQLIRVIGPSSAVSAPLRESFEDLNWASNATDPIRSWRNETTSSGAEKWLRFTGAATEGTASLRLRNPNIPNGTTSTLYSPPINLTTNPGADYQVVFDRAYARRSATSGEVLQVSTSSDCGATWSVQGYYTAAQLASNASGQFVSGAFVPTAADWVTSTVDVPAAQQGAQTLLLRFEATSNAGNYLYLDNIRVRRASVNSARDMARHGISVAPNPLTAETAVQFSLDQAATAQVQVLDLLGRTVLSTPARSYAAGQQRIALGAEGKRLSPGLYVVQLTLGPQRYTSRVLVP